MPPMGDKHIAAKIQRLERFMIIDLIPTHAGGEAPAGDAL